MSKENVCPYCHDEFPSSLGVSEHIKKECTESPRHAEIARENQESADGEFRWRCYVCMAAHFKSEIELINHQRRAHV